MTNVVDPTLQIEGLSASHGQRLPFAASLAIRAFTLSRDAGNLVVYSVDGLGSDPSIAATGGIARQFLNHRHEAMFAADPPEAPVFVHELDRDAVAESLMVRGGFTKRFMLDDDFEVIPIPGHTPGATAYLWDRGDHRLLFTGDSIYLDEGEWIAAVLESSDRAAYIASLELIRGLDFDVLVPWAATEDQPFFDVVNGDAKVRRLDAIINRLHRGEDR